MNLLNLCRQITEGTDHVLPKSHPLGTRLVCPEHSSFTQEVKPYPLLEHERIFALCWDMDAHQNLYATMCPAPENFCYHYKFTSGEKTQLHTHDYIELFYVVEGEFRQKILDKEITFKKGDLCLIDKNCLHQDYLGNQSAVILFLGISHDMLTEIMDENITTEKIILFLKLALLKQRSLKQYLHFHPQSDFSKNMEDCLYQLLKEIYLKDVGSSYICHGLLIRIFHILGGEYEVSFSKEERKNMNWLVFEEISEYIRQHSDTITIQELTTVFHFQEDYFNRLIRRQTGLTYSAYVQQIRLEKAAQLLTTSSLNIEEIAAIVGYNNKGYFYKIFQEKYGITPAGYRKKRT